MLRKLLWGLLFGFAIGMVVNYLFGPADETEYDETYRSRWDKAMEDGHLAADEREQELVEQLQAAKQV